MRKLTAMLLALCMVFSCIIVLAAEEVSAQFIYVAPNGDDAASGTIESPLASVAAAVAKAKAIDGNVVINLREGTYLVSDTVKIDGKDIVIKNYNGEKAILSGANALPYSSFKAVEGEAKDRIISAKAKEAVVAIDLKSEGITEYGSNYVVDHGYGSNPYPPALYINNKSMTVARYPNEGEDYLLTGRVIREGVHSFELYYKDQSYPDPKDVTEDMCFKFECKDARIKNWTKADDIWMFGYWVHDWAEARVGASVNAEEGTVTSKYPAGFGVMENRRYYFYNLLEEIDVPGEWYLDRNTGMLYVYPTSDFDASATIEYITFNKPFFDVSGSENVTIEGINIEKSVGNGVIGDSVKNFTLENCKINNISGDGVNITKATGCTVNACELRNLGAKGVSLEGGDRMTLTPGNNRIENNLITEFAQIKTTYNAGASLGGCGNYIGHNEISETPHMAIGFSGNNHVVEYNDVHDVCKDTSDSGALYVGRNWSSQGNEIRYNYFHDLTMATVNTAYQMQAVYLDDTFSSAKVHGNVFYRCDSVALFGGGRYNTFTSNIILECRKPFVYDARGETWTVAWLDEKDDTSLVKELKKYPYNEGVWAEQYPYLTNILEDDPKSPKYAVVKDNIEYRSAGADIADSVKKYGTVEDFVQIKDTKGFVDYKNKNFTLKEDSEIFTSNPDFEKIDYTKVGRLAYEPSKTYVEKGGETENTPSDEIKVIVNDKPVTFDVAPAIINDRTMVPLRAIFEALGADVDWDDATKTITAVKGETTIKMQIGNDKMTRNGTESTLDSAPVIIDSRTLVPVRAIAESFGSDVSWDGETKTVIIK